MRLRPGNLMNGHICICNSVCMYVSMYMCIFIYMYMYVNLYVCMYVYMFVCMQGHSQDFISGGVYASLSNPSTD